ncbi:radical SAM protein [Streptomyces longisporoflavus]|uniref:Radical SAM protein n=1 Tax=Streptomyces longisporoflavus TaxID=28044 RepID=A0ABW7R557_9ACTN
MTLVPQAPVERTALRFLSLEITDRCQLTCPSMCFVKAGPTRSHGTMAEEDWRRIIDEATTLGKPTVQFIGGEPTLHPAFTTLVGHTLNAGLRVRIYSNLYKVRAEHWQLFSRPNVRLATSYHSDDPHEHDAITGRNGSHAATRANIIEALRRRIPVKVAVIHGGSGQRVEAARAEMLGLGVRDVSIGRLRAVGNAAVSALPSASELCGRCADGKAAILPDGRVAVCEIGRFLCAGDVKHASLASVLGSPQWARLAASVPGPGSSVPCGPDCSPNDDTCEPSGGDTCDPAS